MGDRLVLALFCTLLLASAAAHPHPRPHGHHKHDDKHDKKGDDENNDKDAGPPSAGPPRSPGNGRHHSERPPSVHLLCRKCVSLGYNWCPGQASPLGDDDGTCIRAQETCPNMINATMNCPNTTPSLFKTCETCVSDQYVWCETRGKSSNRDDDDWEDKIEGQCVLGHCEGERYTTEYDCGESDHMSWRDLAFVGFLAAVLPIICLLALAFAMIRCCIRRRHMHHNSADAAAQDAADQQRGVRRRHRFRFWPFGDQARYASVATSESEMQPVGAENMDNDVGGMPYGAQAAAAPAPAPAAYARSHQQAGQAHFTQYPAAAAASAAPHAFPTNPAWAQQQPQQQPVAVPARYPTPQRPHSFGQPQQQSAGPAQPPVQWHGHGQSPAPAFTIHHGNGEGMSHVQVTM